MSIRPTPIRIDPVELLETPKSQTKSKARSRTKAKSRPRSRTKSKAKSRKRSRTKSRTKAKSRTRSRSRSKTKAKSRKRSKTKAKSRTRSRNRSKKKLTIKLTPKEREKYQVPKLERKVMSEFESRVSPERAIRQRLSPYFGQDHDNRPTHDAGPGVIKDLTQMKRKTKNKPILNQLVNENILVRAASDIS